MPSHKASLVLLNGTNAFLGFQRILNKAAAVSSKDMSEVRGNIMEISKEDALVKSRVLLSN